MSFLTLPMKSFGSSGGGAEVSSKDGPVPVVSDGMAADVGSSEAGLFDACPLPSAETTAMATAVPTATVASAPPPISSHLRRRLRVSDASASAAQSGD